MEMRAFRGAATGDLPGHIEDLFFTPGHHLVGPRKVRVRVRHLVVRVEVVFQVSVRQGQGIKGKHILHLFKGLDPARRLMLKILFWATVTLLRHVTLQRRHQVVTGFIGDAGPPAKMIQAVVTDVQCLAGRQTEDVGKQPLDGHRHIADVDNARVGTQATGRFRDDGRRVGVVEHPRPRGVLLHIIDQLQYAGNRAHTVGDPPRPTGFLARHAIFQRDLLILFPHLIQANANMRHHKINVGEGRLRIGGIAEFYLREAFRHQNGAGVANGLLTLVMVIVQTDLPQGKARHIFQQHHDNPWRIGTPAAGNRDHKVIFHLPPRYSVTPRLALTAVRILLTPRP